MTTLISFATYRTERVNIAGQDFTISFAKQTDADQYAVFAVSDDGKKSWRAFHSGEDARNFELYTGQDLEPEMLRVFKWDVEVGQLATFQTKMS